MFDFLAKSAWILGLNSYDYQIPEFKCMSLYLYPHTHIHGVVFNPLAPELDIFSLAHHLCKMLIFYEPGRVALGNTRHFVEE